MLWNIFAELDNNKQSIEKSCFAISNMIFALNAIVKIYIHYTVDHTINLIYVPTYFSIFLCISK